MSQSARLVRELPQALANRLRTTVGITSLAQAVAELLANSLDAKSRRITISLDVPTLSFTIEDDGLGITGRDLQLVGRRYCTSKMTSLADLQLHVDTLGFRGEALSTIADAAELRITSRAKGSFETHYKVLKGGVVIKTGLSSQQLVRTGTVIDVTELLFNQPVRRRQLASDVRGAEQEVMLDVVRTAWPFGDAEVTLVSRRTSRPLLQLPAGRGLLTCRSDHLLSGQPPGLRPLSAQDPSSRFSAHAVLSDPAHPSPGRDQQWLFVNRRFVRHPAVSSMLDSWYKRAHEGHLRSAGIAPNGGPGVGHLRAYPAYIIEVACPLEEYDITSEPDKSSIAFRNLQPITALIQQLAERVWGPVRAGYAVEGATTGRSSRQRPKAQPASLAAQHEAGPFTPSEPHGVPSLRHLQPPAIQPGHVRSCGLQHMHCPDQAHRSAAYGGQLPGKGVVAPGARPSGGMLQLLSLGTSQGNSKAVSLAALAGTATTRPATAPPCAHMDNTTHPAAAAMPAAAMTQQANGIGDRNDDSAAVEPTGTVPSDFHHMPTVPACSEAPQGCHGMMLDMPSIKHSQLASPVCAHPGVLGPAAAGTHSPLPDISPGLIFDSASPGTFMQSTPQLIRDMWHQQQEQASPYMGMSSSESPEVRLQCQHQQPQDQGPPIVCTTSFESPVVQMTQPKRHQQLSQASCRVAVTTPASLQAHTALHGVQCDEELWWPGVNAVSSSSAMAPAAGEAEEARPSLGSWQAGHDGSPAGSNAHVGVLGEPPDSVPLSIEDHVWLQRPQQQSHDFSHAHDPDTGCRYAINTTSHYTMPDLGAMPAHLQQQHTEPDSSPSAAESGADEDNRLSLGDWQDTQGESLGGSPGHVDVLRSQPVSRAPHMVDHSWFSPLKQQSLGTDHTQEEDGHIMDTTGHRMLQNQGAMPSRPQEPQHGALGPRTCAAGSMALGLESPWGSTSHCWTGGSPMPSERSTDESPGLLGRRSPCSPTAHNMPAVVGTATSFAQLNADGSAPHGFDQVPGPKPGLPPPIAVGMPLEWQGPFASPAPGCEPSPGIEEACRLLVFSSGDNSSAAGSRQREARRKQQDNAQAYCASMAPAAASSALAGLDQELGGFDFQAWRPLPLDRLNMSAPPHARKKARTVHGNPAASLSSKPAADLGCLDNSAMEDVPADGQAAAAALCVRLSAGHASSVEGVAAEGCTTRWQQVQDEEPAPNSSSADGDASQRSCRAQDHAPLMQSPTRAAVGKLSVKPLFPSSAKVCSFFRPAPTAAAPAPTLLAADGASTSENGQDMPPAGSASTVTQVAAFQPGGSASSLTPAPCIQAVGSVRASVLVSAASAPTKGATIATPAEHGSTPCTEQDRLTDIAKGAAAAASTAGLFGSAPNSAGALPAVRSAMRNCPAPSNITTGHLGTIGPKKQVRFSLPAPSALPSAQLSAVSVSEPSDVASLPLSQPRTIIAATCAVPSQAAALECKWPLPAVLPAVAADDDAKPGDTNVSSLLQVWRNPVEGHMTRREVLTVEQLQPPAAEALAGPGGVLVPREVEKDALTEAQSLRQVDSKFLPVVCGEVLLVADQHAAHERIRLEHLTAQLQSVLPVPRPCGSQGQSSIADGAGSLARPQGALAFCGTVFGVKDGPTGQNPLSHMQLPCCQDILLSGHEVVAWHQHASTIQAWGWRLQPRTSTEAASASMDVTVVGTGAATSLSMTLTYVPAIYGVQLTTNDFKAYLHQLHDTCGSDLLPAGVLRVLRSKACRSAIMFGDKLQHEQSVALVQQLRGTQLWMQCAHGRPTVVPLVHVPTLRKLVGQKRQLAQVAAGLTASTEQKVDSRVPLVKRLRAMLQQGQKRHA